MKLIVGFNEDTKVATILQPDSEMPQGSVKVGEFMASAVGPNARDVSHQHIYTMLQRHGINDTSSITVEREPIAEVVNRQEADPIEENMAPIADAIPPETLELGVDESADLVNGSTRNVRFEVSDEEIVKIDKRGGKVTGLKAGTATVTVKDAEGNANQVVITVREPVTSSSTGAPSGSDAKEAETENA